MDRIREKMEYTKRKENLPLIQEKKILETIEASKQALFESKRKETISYFEFLFIQTRFINKRWWLSQVAILIILWYNLFTTQNHPTVYREAGILIPVFVILIIPELWKNVRTNSWEIENSAFYTLRQIYSARLLLFGSVDLLLLSTFFITTALTIQTTLYDMIIQCLLPFNITCCICFGLLCSKRLYSEYIAIVFCMIGATIWYKIVTNEKLYASVSDVGWLMILGVSVVYLLFVIYRLLKNSAKYCEVDYIWN